MFMASHLFCLGIESLVNRFERLLREMDPTVSMHYWDWQTDPRRSPDANGNEFNLFSMDFMGNSNGLAGSPLESLYYNGSGNPRIILDGNIRLSPNPQDPPLQITRYVGPGRPPINSDHDIVSTGDKLGPDSQWPVFWRALNNAHGAAHDYIGGYDPNSNPGTLTQSHISFQDPFVFLLHSNVDRLWASWQLRTGMEWRLNPDAIYGNERDHANIEEHMQPWAGDNPNLSLRITPWTQPNPQESKNSKDPSIIRCPLYDDYLT